MRKAIGIEVRYLSTMIAKEVEQSQLFKENPDLTNVKGWTMGFIYRRCQKGFCNSIIKTIKLYKTMVY